MFCATLPALRLKESEKLLEEIETLQKIYCEGTNNDTYLCVSSSTHRLKTLYNYLTSIFPRDVPLQIALRNADLLDYCERKPIAEGEDTVVLMRRYFLAHLYREFQLRLAVAADYKPASFKLTAPQLKAIFKHFPEFTQGSRKERLTELVAARNYILSKHGLYYFRSMFLCTNVTVNSGIRMPHFREYLNNIFQNTKSYYNESSIVGACNIIAEHNKLASENFLHKVTICDTSIPQVIGCRNYLRLQFISYLFGSL